MARRRVGVVGGTGFYSWSPRAETLDVETPYGTVPVQYAKEAKSDVFFLPRHGASHAVPPHRVNHRAHIAAMAAVKPEYVLGVFNVGAVDPAIADGTWTILSDFLDLRGGTPMTFHDNEAVHVDMGQPYCPTARAALVKTAPRLRRTEAVYAAVAGPRFDSAAETAMMRMLGAHVVGMTGAPEVILAREAGLCYAGVALVANAAADNGVLRATDVQAALARRVGRARQWILDFAAATPAKKACRCKERAGAGRLAEVAA